MKVFIKNIFAVLIVAGASFILLLAFNLVPEEIKGFWSTVPNINSEVPAASLPKQGPDVSVVSNNYVVSTAEVSVTISSGAEPDRLIIPKIAVDTFVSNPQTRDVAVLDAELLKGVVHYPGSGSLGGNDNIFLFGHSSNWPVVRNQAFKSLNGLDKLVIGDAIKVRSGSREYLYKVFAVTLADSKQSLITISKGRRMVTISTCDTFGQKSDRIVVEAAYERDYEI